MIINLAGVLRMCTTLMNWDQGTQPSSLIF